MLLIGILAASSKFFASLLPDGELEHEICISTEVLYSDLLCILEYMYSGKLLCSLQQKDEILLLLKEYQVFVPDNWTAGASLEESKLIDIEAPITAKRNHRISNNRQPLVNQFSSSESKDLDHNYFITQIAQDVPIKELTSSDDTISLYDVNSSKPELIDLEAPEGGKQNGEKKSNKKVMKQQRKRIFIKITSNQTTDDVSQNLATERNNQDSTVSNDSNLGVETEEDVDLALSKHFLQHEKMKKKKLQFKIKKYSRNLEEYETISFNIVYKLFSNSVVQRARTII